MPARQTCAVGTVKFRLKSDHVLRRSPAWPFSLATDRENTGVVAALGAKGDAISTCAPITQCPIQIKIFFDHMDLTGGQFRIYIHLLRAEFARQTALVSAGVAKRLAVADATNVRRLIMLLPLKVPLNKIIEMLTTEIPVCA